MTVTSKIKVDDDDTAPEEVGPPPKNLTMISVKVLFRIVIRDVKEKGIENIPILTKRLSVVKSIFLMSSIVYFGFIINL